MLFFTSRARDLNAPLEPHKWRWQPSASSASPIALPPCLQAWGTRARALWLPRCCGAHDWLLLALLLILSLRRRRCMHRDADVSSRGRLLTQRLWCLGKQLALLTQWLGCMGRRWALLPQALYPGGLPAPPLTHLTHLPDYQAVQRCLLLLRNGAQGLVQDENGWRGGGTQRPRHTQPLQLQAQKGSKFRPWTLLCSEQWPNFIESCRKQCKNGRVPPPPPPPPRLLHIRH